MEIREAIVIATQTPCKVLGHCDRFWVVEIDGKRTLKTSEELRFFESLTSKEVLCK